MISRTAPLNFPREKVGLCMIVKDESRALGRCLDSVRDWVSEMVVVDTGSTDDTVAIAISHGASVSHFPWCDDFSAARNVALEKATREWVLVLDADETCSVDSPTEFANALQQTRFDGFSLPISSLNDDGTYSQAMVFRLFRRKLPGMRYRGEIHEQLEAVAAGKVRTATLSCIRLDHDGYTAAIFSSRDKGSRNIRLSQKVTQSRPDDPFSWFIHAMAIAQSDPDGMLRAAQKAIALIELDVGRVRGELYVVNLYLAVISVYQSRNQVASMLEVADKALALFPDSPDLRYQRGSARIVLGDFVGAVEDFEAALGAPAQAFKLIVDPASRAHGSRMGLARALRRLGRADQAIAQLRLAVDQAPTDVSNAHVDLGDLLIERGALDQATLVLEEALRRTPASTDVALKLGWCCYKMARFERAEGILRNQARGSQVDLLLGRVLLDSGKAHEALDFLHKNPLAAALLPLGWSYFVLGDAQAAAHAWDPWMAQAPIDSSSRVALTLMRVLLTGDGFADDLAQWSDEFSRDMESWMMLLLRYQQAVQVEQIIGRGALLGPSIWSALRMRWAQTLVVEGYVDLGLTLLLDAARDTPQDGSVFYWLGYCASLRQLTDDARALFEECLRCDPGHPQARQALELLN